MRLGGEYYRPQYKNNPTQARARKEFLVAIAELCPQVLESLYALHQSDPLCHDPYLLNTYILTLDGISLVPERPELGQLEKTLSAWLEASHLPQDNWMLQVTADTLFWWCALPAEYLLDPDHRYFKPPDVNVKSPAMPRPALLLNAHWYPGEETRADAKKRLRAMLEAALDEYLDSVEAAVQEEGWLAVPEKRARDDPRQHFRWLARYVIQGWSYEEIAQEVTDLDPTGEAVIGVDAVRKAITTTAALIGLKLQD